jgi:transcriptional regulator with XRE-family HTH domain
MGAFLATIPAMPPEEFDALVAQLKAWCKKKHGRQKILAEELGITEQLLSNWIAKRKTPGLENYLKLQAFLKNQRKHR